MSEMLLALDELDPDPEQVRLDFPHADIEARAKSIRKFGQLYPVLVRRGENGRWTLVDGEMRWRAIQLLHKKDPSEQRFAKIRAVAQDNGNLEGDARLAIQLAANDQRTDLTPYERILAVSKLRELHGRSELQEALGITDGQMRLLREIADAPNYVWEYGAARRYPKKEKSTGRGRPPKGWLQCEPLGVTHLREVAVLAKKLRSFDEEQQRVTDQRHTPVAQKEIRRLCEKAQREAWSVAQVRSRCESVHSKYFTEQPNEQASQPSEPVFRHTATRLTVSLDRIAEMSQEERTALSSTLRELLETLDTTASVEHDN